jgi:hypothetical protein
VGLPPRCWEVRGPSVQGLGFGACSGTAPEALDAWQPETTKRREMRQGHEPRSEP